MHVLEVFNNDTMLKSHSLHLTMQAWSAPVFVLVPWVIISVRRRIATLTPL